MSKPIALLFCLATALLISRHAAAQSGPAAYCVQAEATVQDNPPVITLHWQRDPHAVQYEIYMRNLGDNSWNDLGPVDGTDTLFADSAESIGTTYEYEIVDSAKSDSVYAAIGFVATGIDVYLPVSPGKVILLVDNTYTTPLSTEISQLITDLKAEGWGVIRHDVSRTDLVPTVKALVQKDYLADSIHVRSLFILGHVPVPYSGDIAPDGHYPGLGNHQGAWPADIYYGNFYTKWTDTKVDDTTADDPRNKNVPGDGKFDQDSIINPDNPEELEVGRVDLYDMPSFMLSDTALMKQYLDRDHAFRTGALKVPQRGLINDNFGIIAGHEYDVPATDGWRNFPPLVGADNIYNFHSLSSATDWFSYLDTAQYLWAYGCGGGTWTSCNGVGATSQYANPGAEGVFNMLFGSFFGDWDHSDGLLRAPLATSYGLTNCWAGRPYWYFHPLGMGGTFGYCAKLTQNVADGPIYVSNGGKHIVFVSDYVWSLSMSDIHIALMGDPTLRMEYLSDPPTGLSASAQGNSVKLTWSHPKIAVPGYNVYRASGTGDTLLQINTSPVTVTQFTDLTPLNDSNIYVVRAAELTTTPSGTWWNESGGVTQSIKFTQAGVADNAAATEPPQLSVNREGDFLDIAVHTDASTPVRLSIVDVTGREVSIVADAALSSGSYSYQQDIASFASGVYFVRMLTSTGVISQKVLITR